jgi:hypothetical protein
VRAEWLYGARCAQFSTSVTFGRSGVHHVKAEARASEVAEAARELRDKPDCQAHAFHGGIRRGRGGWHDVQIPVPRAMLLGIADALAGAIDDDDAGHCFYHWESPSTPRPCSSCRATRDAADARVDAARSQLVCTWSAALGVPAETVERLLLEFDILPRRALR